MKLRIRPLDQKTDLRLAGVTLIDPARRVLAYLVARAELIENNVLGASCHRRGAVIEHVGPAPHTSRDDLIHSFGICDQEEHAVKFLRDESFDVCELLYRIVRRVNDDQIDIADSTGLTLHVGVKL